MPLHVCCPRASGITFVAKDACDWAKAAVQCHPAHSTTLRMLSQLVNVANFDDRGAFLERHSSAGGEEPLAEDAQRRQSSSDRSLLDLSLGSASGSGSTSLSDPTHPPSSLVSVLSFESYLTVGPAFLARNVTRSATEATLLLDISRTAIEMDAITECALEQLQDHEQLTREIRASKSTGSESGGASLSTALLVLLSQATAAKEDTLSALLDRMQRCLNRLAQMRFPLAQCIEFNETSAQELVDRHTATSRRLLAKVEADLLGRLTSLVKPQLQFKMSPLRVPRTSGSHIVCWPGSSSDNAPASSPSHSGIGDVRLSSSSQTPSSSSTLSASSTSTLTSSLLSPITPQRYPDMQPDVGSSSSSSRRDEISTNLNQPNTDRE